MSAPSPFAFTEALHEVRDRLRVRLGLTAVELPDELARAESQLHGEPIHYEAELLDGRVRARFATVTGRGIEVASALAVAPSALALPIFGADLVALGRGRALVVLDLSPTARSFAGHDLLGLGARLRERPQLATAGSLPAWCAGLLSTHHVFARIDQSDAAAARELLADFADAFAELVAAGEPRAQHSDVSAVTARRWLSAHRDDDKSFTVLAHAFGEEWTQRAIQEVLFPASWP